MRKIIEAITIGEIGFGRIKHVLVAKASFPSPADDCVERDLSLDAQYIKNPSSTYFVVVAGNSMIGAGIFNGDKLLVDRSITPQSGRVIIAFLDGEFLVKRYRVKRGRHFLCSENLHPKQLEVTHNKSFMIWGVVEVVLHRP